MVSVLTCTVVGSYIASLLPSATMGSFSVFMTFLLGIKFIVRPVMTTKEAMQGISAKKRAVQSIVCGGGVAGSRLSGLFSVVGAAGEHGGNHDDDEKQREKLLQILFHLNPPV